MPQSNVVPGATQPLNRPTRADIITALNDAAAKLNLTNANPQQLLPQLSEIDFGISKDAAVHAAVQRNTFSFRFWQVEQLLDQAADLFDRGLRDRETYNGLRVEFTRLLIELAEFAELDRIHQAEIAAGWYSVEFEQSKPLADGAAAERDGYSQAATSVRNVVSAEFSDIETRALAAGVAAKISGYDSYKGQHAAGLAPSAENHDVGFNHVGETLVRQNDGYAGNGTDGDYTHGTAAGTVLKTDVIKQIAHDQYKHTLNVEQVGLTAQQSSFSIQSSSASSRFTSLDRKQQWDHDDVALRRSRSEAAIKVNQMKVINAVEPGGSYNYPERLAPIRDRFRRDFWDGYTRLQSATDGLRQIFNFDVSGFPLLSNSTPDTSQAFDQCLIWTRDAIRFLTAFKTSEQSYVKTISLKHFLGKKEWKTAKDDIEDQPQLPLTLGFVLDPSEFASQSFVRLQGLSVFIVGREGPYRVSVTAPASALYIFPNKTVPVSQADVKPVFVRALERKNPRSGDVVGVSSLRNVSPISNRPDPGAGKFWKVVVDRTSALGENAMDLDDIHVDLYCAVQQS